MMRMGISKEAAAHACRRDGVDPDVLDMDPEKSPRRQRPEDRGDGGDESLKSQRKIDDGGGPPLKDDPKYTKVIRTFRPLLFCLLVFPETQFRNNTPDSTSR